ncbi:MAG TPA: STAS domain-containing protein [Casimicrobiaceae bacterium]|nr:STAS domain-containing protein [Casimicrobiaceae bacterium]
MAIVTSAKLDWTAYRDLRPVVAAALDRAQCATVRLDLSHVVAVEPAGIGALVVLSQMAARRDKTLLLDGVSPRFDMLLRDCGLALAGTPGTATRGAGGDATAGEGLPR